MNAQPVPPGPRARRDGPETTYACAACGFTLWHPVWSFEHTVLGLYDDARFPGRCLLALRDHAAHFEELSSDRIAALMHDTARVGAVIRKLVDADRVNYAVLGNTEPHVHAHIIPRLHRIDPTPRRPPWEHPDPVKPLPEGHLERLAQGIIDALTPSGNTVGA